MFKNLLLRNHKGDEVETWHTCLGHWPLQKLCFYTGRIRTLVAMATYSSIDLQWENWKLTVSAVSLEIFDFFLHICLLSNPPCCIRLLSK